MTLYELITTNPYGDIDTYPGTLQTVDGCCICGKYELTDSAKKEFANALNVEIVIENNEAFAYQRLNSPLYNEIKRLIWSLAGYCSVEDYDKWFKEIDE